MQTKTLLSRALLVIGVLAIASFVVYTFFPTFFIPNAVPNLAPIPIPPVISQTLQNLIDAQSQGARAQDQSSANLPSRLIIPSIGVNASVEYLGVTSSGAMDVPKGPNDVAWFDLGPRPGEQGSAVIAGHEGWKNNIPAVFDHLVQMKVGDTIEVIDTTGATTTFIVNGVGTYDQNGNATKVFSSNDGKAHLNLITCEGTWNAAEKSYSNRLVIFAQAE